MAKNYLLNYTLIDMYSILNSLWQLVNKTSNTTWQNKCIAMVNTAAVVLRPDYYGIKSISVVHCILICGVWSKLGILTTATASHASDSTFNCCCWCQSFYFRILVVFWIVFKQFSSISTMQIKLSTKLATVIIAQCILPNRKTSHL